MVKIRINDRELEVPDTATVLEAALRAGIDIPYMCYHPGMKVVAVCRVCQVEIRGMPKLQAACSTPVRAGMEVLTETPAARKARRGTVEFWLLNHPLDCPICDKAGECPLQDVTFNLRDGGSRLRDPKVHRPKRKVLGPHIVFDVERCILCWRCTRFTQDISGSDQLLLVGRGVKTEIDTLPCRPLTDPFSGNVADVCPVGALTTREFRFKSRPWEMTPVESTCTACPVGCSNTLWSKRGVMQRMTARANPAVNDYWLCDRGRFDLEFVNDPARLARPVLDPARLVPARLVPAMADSARAVELVSAASPAADGSVSWDEAAGALAGLARDGGPWAVIASPHATNEEYFALQRFARGVLGTSDLLLDTGPDGPELSARRVALLESGRLLPAVADLDQADVIVQVGGDLEATHPVYSLRIRKAVRDGGAVLHLAPTATGGLDREAATRVALPAGGELAFLESVAGGAAAGGGPGAGASAGPNAAIAAALLGARRGVLILNAGSRNESLLAAAGKLLDANPAGLRLFLLDDGPNVTGAWDAGFAPAHFPGCEPVNAAGAAARAAEWGERVPGSPGRGRAGILAGLADGSIPGVILFNSGRPWSWSPDVMQALAGVRARVVFDLLPGPAVGGAALVLPAPSMAELDGTVTAPDHRVLLLRRAVAGPTGLWHPAAFLARVERLAGGAARSGMPVDVFRDLARAVGGYEGMNFGRLRPAGLAWQPPWAAERPGAGAAATAGANTLSSASGAGAASAPSTPAGGER